MKAMVLKAPGTELTPEVLHIPRPNKKEALIKVHACAVCRTDVHIVDGDLKPSSYPVILGHEIVGTVEECGPQARRFSKGELVGVPWLGKACGGCEFCLKGQENLCNRPEFTGFSRPGGFAEYTLAHEDFIFKIPDSYTPVEAAPLLCAGLIGFRSYRMIRDAPRIGLYGFGAAAHIIAQVALFEGHEVCVFTRPGDRRRQSFARDLGCHWAGGANESPPVPLDAAIIFAPVGELIPAALRALKKGGTCVCAGIHMTDIPSFPYSLLWGERVLRSVANLTREDGEEFFKIAPRIPVRPRTTIFELEEANTAIKAIKEGAIEGAAVLKIFIANLK